MSISFPKTGLSIQGQLKHMASCGLIIRDMASAEATLNHLSFYRLRGYYIHCYNRQTKQFHAGTTFENIVSLHDFDKELSSLILTVTSQIEISLRAYLTNEICWASTQTHAMGHLDIANYASSQLFMDNLGKISAEIGRSKELYIEHFRCKYNCQVPIWAALEVASFGTISKLFKSLDTPIKKTITHKYYQYTTLDWVESWLQTATIIRNMCAHQARLYNRTTGARPTILAGDAATNVRPETVYGSILAMKYLTQNTSGASTWLIELKQLFGRYSSVVDLTRLGFPADWQTHLC